jgi:hypothetical protein
MMEIKTKGISLSVDGLMERKILNCIFGDDSPKAIRMKRSGWSAKRYSEEEKNKIMNLHSTGIKVKEIARITGRTVGGISAAIWSWGRKDENIG